MEWVIDEDDPDLMAASLFCEIFLERDDFRSTDSDIMILTLPRDILSLFSTDIIESELESKLIPLIAQWISILPSIDRNPQSEAVSGLQSLIARKISVDKLKREPVSPIHPINSPEKKPTNLICLSPQVTLDFEEGKFSVSGKVDWSSNSNDHCWFNERKQGIYFLCRNCNGKYHEEYKKAVAEIKNHHLHPKHQLQLATTGLLRRSRECYCCDDYLLRAFYYCSTCDFSLNVACVEKPPLSLAIDHPKWHDHTLALFNRRSSLNCSLCALADLYSPIYICPPCGFVAHLRCIRNLPRVIRISRHLHRLSFTHSFDDQRDPWSCGVCRRKMDSDYGGYSCIKDGCSYAVHSKCATQSNVWDGIDLEGEPEEVEEDEDIEPFVRISDGIIQHFSHQHHLLRLLEENPSGDYDDSKQCQACITPIYFGNFYSCTQCDYILHEACANISRKIHHPVHPHQLALVTEYDGGTNNNNVCSACPAYCNGFAYKCSKEECRFKVHVQCATLSEPLVHRSHMHPLFLTSRPGERRTCSVCQNYQYNGKETFNCIECDFALCFACATLPQKVRYKYDNHILTLSYGEETSSMAYWCEACETKIDLKKQFYQCNEHCCVTLHTECLLGRTLYTKPKSLFHFSGKTVGVLRNDSMSRPFCETCRKRCKDIVYFHRVGSLYCSLHCVY